MSYRDGEYTEQLTAHVTRLLGTYFTPSPEKIASYVRALRFKAISADRVARAVDELIATHSKCPMPAQVISAALGRAGESPGDAERRAEQAKVLRYYLERYSDADYYEFARAFGFTPSLALYQRMKIDVPEGCTFHQPTRAWCEEQRAQARASCEASFARFRMENKLAGAPAPVPAERRALPLPAQIGLELEPDEPPNLLAEEPVTGEPPIGDEPVWDEEAALEAFS